MTKYRRFKFKDGSSLKVHRVIWSKFHGEIPNGYIIHHKNGNSLDNRLDNLEMMLWGEHSRMRMIIRGNQQLRRDITHGTTSGYRRGCRCLECKKHHNARLKNYRRRKKQEKLKEETLELNT